MFSTMTLRRALALVFILPVSALAADLPSFSELPSRTEQPDPLVMLDGSPVKSKRAWERRRRSELKELFQHYMYGPLPPKPAILKFTVTGEHADFLNGKATLKLVTISFGDADGPKIDLLVVTPNQRKGHVPAFLAMNFCGNHAVTADPRVPLSRGWLYDSCKGCVQNHATDAARGGQQADWPLETIIDRGYAFATFCSTDVDSDRKDVSDGIYAWLAKQGWRPNEPHNRGSIAAWAWGFHRCVDALLQERAIDPKRIAAVGHSRNGKTALLAAAFDERIALAIPHQAGCGGTAPNRVAANLAAPQANGRPIAETLPVINKNFPHWFNAEFKQFNDDPTKLPFDQNALVALVAPRPVLFSNAAEDTWANPSGQFEVLRAAEPVYRFLKAGGLDATSMPPEGKLLASKLGYYIRPGKHSMTAGDWGVFLDFADAHLRR
jgi:hypothetical protein